MVERIKKACLIYNPDLQKKLSSRMVTCGSLTYLKTWAMKPRPSDLLQNHFLLKMKQKEPPKQADGIIAAGGDGTINEGSHGVAGLENRPQMAFYSDRLNDYARALKIPMGDLCSGCSHYRKESNHSDGYWS